MCEYHFLFVLCQNGFVMCFCTTLSAVFDWTCALQVFIIIIITKLHYEKHTFTEKIYADSFIG